MFKRSKIAKTNSNKMHQKEYGSSQFSSKLFSSTAVSSNIRLFGSMINELTRNDIDEQLKWLEDSKLVKELSVTDTSEKAEEDQLLPQQCFFSANWKKERKKQTLRRERQRKKRRKEERLGKGGTTPEECFGKERTIGR